MVMVSLLEAIEDEDGEVVRDQITEILDETPGSLDFYPSTYISSC